MKQRLALAAALLVMCPVAMAVADTAPLQTPNYQKICTDGVRKLAVGEQVIGASQSSIAAAQAARTAAQNAMQSQDYYGCSQSVKKGLDALNAG